MRAVSSGVKKPVSQNTSTKSASCAARGIIAITFSTYCSLLRPRATAWAPRKVERMRAPLSSRQHLCQRPEHRRRRWLHMHLIDCNITKKGRGISSGLFDYTCETPSGRLQKKASHSEWDALNKLKEMSFPNDTQRYKSISNCQRLFFDGNIRLSIHGTMPK